MTYIQRSKFSAVVVGLSLFLSGCAQASSSDTPPTEADQAVQLIEAEVLPEGNWDIRSDDSYIRFSAEQEGKLFTGTFTEFSGIIQFDPTALEEGAVRIEIPLSAVDAGSKDRNSTLPGKLWFSTKKFPKAVFSSTDLTQVGDGYLARGVLKLKGKTVPLELPFDLNILEDQAVMTGKVAIDRTDWDVGTAPWDTDEWVSRRVNIDVKVTANRK